MSTRCQIIVETPNGERKNFYRHHNGWPDEILPMLDQHINQFLHYDDSKVKDLPSPFLNFKTDINTEDDFVYMYYGNNEELQGDIDYVYKITPAGIIIYCCDFSNEMVFDQRDGEHDMYLCLHFDNIVILNKVIEQR